MKRISSSLISLLGINRRSIIATLCGRDVLPSAPRLSFPSHFPFSARIQAPDGLVHSRSLATIPETGPSLSLPPRQRKNKKNADLEEAFEAAATTEDIFSAFAALESSLGEHDMKLGLACLKVGQHLDSIGFSEEEDSEKILEYAQRALAIFDREDDGSISVIMALHLIGSATYNLRKYGDSLGYLNRANRLLRKLQNSDTTAGEFDLLPVSHAVQLLLANAKTALGRREEALENLKNCLEIKEVIMDPNCRELGVANRDLAEAYVSVLNFNQALPYCLKALGIHKDELGENSVEVAHDRRLLGVIYTGLEQHQKAIEQNELSRSILTRWCMTSELADAEIEAANIQIAMGKFEEAVSILRRVVPQTEADSERRAAVFISMAKALCNQEKFGDSKRCLQLSSGILEKREQFSPVKVAEAYAEISMLYETMNEFETAIALLKRTVSILERHPKEQHAEGSAAARIGWLLLLTGKVQEALPYLEDAAERLKESFGPKHFGVGYVYNNLGAAYMELERPQSAAQMFAFAKDIMETSLGPLHNDSIEACQNLANAYGAMGSYGLAMEFQQKVIDAWQNYGIDAKDELREAHRLLEQLKKKALGSPSPLPLPLRNQ